jgi:uncharacterized protein YyaL (SSP411 family)
MTDAAAQQHAQPQPQPRFTNRLVRESSPYLRQHAHNPVDWFPWGEEAFARARQLDRPIFLSIGYSSCHWCHVMERESFESPEVARLLNESFVSVKVDREERPDVDQIYLNALHFMGERGGWPLSMFLTPDLAPFTGGTYFPPENRHGRPGFPHVLRRLAALWRDERDRLVGHARDVADHLQHLGRIDPGEEEDGGGGDSSLEPLRQAADDLRRTYDRTHGGFGQAPKFLHTMDLRVLLRVAKRFGEEADCNDMVRHTLTRMAMGGLYDHLGGGFARYSTDDRWLAPHFEKMLYDNALLTVAYLEAYQATKDPFFAEVVNETLEWVRREMTSPQGPFYSALDADSAGEEGKFYVWTAGEIEAVLGKANADLFASAYGVVPEGNWEDPHHPGAPKNILHLTRPVAEMGDRTGMPLAVVRKFLADCRRKLFDAREERVRPGLDDKALTAWNGLMITALATAAQILDRPDYAERAAKAAGFILARMRAPDGRLLRTWSAGAEARLNGYLEDYAYLLEGLVALYEATCEPRWVGHALELATLMVDQFWDEEGKGFFFTGRDHERLLARPKDPHDGATPAANAVAATALLRLVRLTGRNDLMDRAEELLRLYQGILRQHPTAASQMLIALDFHAGPVLELAVVGDPSSEKTRRVLRAIHADFRPNKVVALRPEAGCVREDWVPLLAGRHTPPGEVTLYVCENFACRAPVRGADAAEATVRGL